MLGKHHTARIQAKNAYGQSKLTSLVVELKQKLLITLLGFTRGQTDARTFELAIKRLLKQGHEQAYLLGMNATGFEGNSLPEVDRKWVTQNRYDEHTYLNAFIDDVGNGRGRLNYSKRLMLYADAVKGTYNAGRNAYMPTNMLVYWRLETGINPKTGKKVNHCDSCKTLSEMSPFTVQNLPLVPRTNHTLCMSGCKCKLVYVSSTEAKVREINNKLGASRTILAKLKARKLIK